MIVGAHGPVLVVSGREAFILRDALRRWLAEHDRAGARQKTLAVLPLLREWERVADTYAHTLMSADGHGAGGEAPTSGSVRGEEISTGEAAERLGVSDRHVRRLIDSGDLEARRVGRLRLVDSHAVEHLRRGRSA